MAALPDPILRRDFPASRDGYDRAAVDAHLQRIADALGRADATAGQTGADQADGGQQVLAAGRLLVAEIGSLRADLKRVSASLRQQSETITATLDQLLDVEETAAPPGRAPAPADRAPPADAPVPPGAPVRDTDAATGTIADARLVALDLALGGGSREEIDAELAARFELADRAALVDDVLAAIGVRR